MSLKPIPRLILIIAAVGGIGFGVNKYFESTGGGLKNLVKESVVIQSADVPTGDSTPAQQTSTSYSSGSLAPATGSYTPKLLTIPWNATTALLYANGDAVTKKGSLMDKHGVHLNIERQDDYSVMTSEMAIFAGEIAKGVANPTKGAAFVVIMGDGGPGFAASANQAMSKLGQHVEVVGAVGYSRGEDKCMVEAQFEQNLRGTLIGAVPRDGDQNICIKKAIDTGVPINPNPKTFDPDAMNFIEVGSFNEADEKMIAASKGNGCEVRPVVKGNALTGENRKVCQNGTATWTPGDVKIAREVGGLVSVASTAEYKWQMPSTIIGNAQWMAQNPEFVKNMLAATFEASDRIKSSDAELLKGSTVAANVFKEQQPEWWKKYFKGVVENDRKGRPISLGGSTTNNLADNLFLFGLNGNDNLYKRVYTVFGDIQKRLYPNDMPTILPYESYVNTKYLQDLAATTTVTKADVTTYSATAPTVSTFATREWAIEFETGKASFKPQSTAVLEDLLNQMSISGLPIQLSGHTDNVGNSATNLALSKRRAEAVRDWLQANASSTFPEGRIRIRSYGDTQPVADNSTAEGRAKNRRVEVALIKTN
ncbi:OmpA family protein [Collimonas sp. NPDC087041]|uniref:OmpA family protein n=1 Tax=Collimonas sp. NPDC087041 TaxID=3363960 RepID=UPI00382611B6